MTAFLWDPLVSREVFESLWTRRGIGLCRIGSR